MLKYAGVLAACAIAVAGLGSTAAAAETIGEGHVVPLGTCNNSYHPSTTGGEAAWNLVCAAGGVTMSGWVKDTKADGRCAYIKAFAGNGDSRVPLAKACPKGKVTQFSWRVQGTSQIRAYLYVA
jgi:hypothetical protein